MCLLWKLKKKSLLYIRFYLNHISKISPKSISYQTIMKLLLPITTPFNYSNAICFTTLNRNYFAPPSSFLSFIHIEATVSNVNGKKYQKCDNPPTTVQFVIKSINFIEDFHEANTHMKHSCVSHLIKLCTVETKHINMPRSRMLYVTPWTWENYVITCCLTYK